MRSRRVPILLLLTTLGIPDVVSLARPHVDDDKPELVPRAKAAESAAPLPRANIRIDTNLVLIPVTVTDPLNRFVTGLEQDSFRVFEDKLEQKVVSFGSEDAPLSVGIGGVICLAASVAFGFWLPHLRPAARELIGVHLEIPE